LPIPSISLDPTLFATIKVADAVVGSASLPKSSPLAFLYTNAVPSSVLTMIDTSDAAEPPSFFKLWAPIQAVFPTDDAKHAVVLHSTAGLEGSQYPAAVSVLPGRRRPAGEARRAGRAAGVDRRRARRAPRAHRDGGRAPVRPTASTSPRCRPSR
jgi:hypothetical protein